MHEPSALSLLPPLLAIVLAMTTRQVILSLGGGIWLGYCLLLWTNPFTGLAASIEGVIAVFQDAGNTRVIAYADEIDVVLAEAEEARRSVDALLAVIRDDCAPAGSSTAELSTPESGATAVPQYADAPISPARCRVIGAAAAD